MESCPYFRLESMPLETVEARRDRQHAGAAGWRVKWCSHPLHSPMPREIARGLVNKCDLRCEGDVLKCPLSEKQLLEV